MALLLPRSLFFHIPKTGGSWVRRAVKRAGIPADEVIPDVPAARLQPGDLIHALPMQLQIRNRFRFAFVRHPLTYYQSYWSYRMKVGWDPERNVVDRKYRSDDFETFVRSVLAKVPDGWVSAVYERYLGTDFLGFDFVGQMERLSDDLVVALTFAGETFNEEALRDTPLENTASQEQEWVPRCQYTPDLRALVCRAERRAMRHFGYSAEESAAIVASGREASIT